MTVVLGFIDRNFSIIAADTRGLQMNSDGTKTYLDDHEKLSISRFGWISGGGSHGVIAGFSYYFNTCEPKYRDDLYTYFIRAMVEMQDNCPEIFENSQTEHMFLSSSVMYFLNRFKDDGLHMEIEAIDVLHKRCKVKDINTLIVDPPEDSEEIKNLIAQYVETTKGENNIHTVLYKMARFVDELSKLTDKINNSISYGISLKKADDSGVFLIKMRESAETIKRLYDEQKDLKSLMNFVSTIEIQK